MLSLILPSAKVSVASHESGSAFQSISMPRFSESDCFLPERSELHQLKGLNTFPAFSCAVIVFSGTIFVGSVSYHLISWRKALCYNCRFQSTCCTTRAEHDAAKL